MPDSNLVNSSSPFVRDLKKSTSPASALDNPIWNALKTEHSSLALGDGLARRYPDEIGPLSGIASQSRESYEVLRALVARGDVVALFFVEPPAPPEGWTLVRGGLIAQMICLDAVSPAPDSARPEMRSLTLDDVPAMVALAELTEPGPFRRRTIELGKFFGIFESGRLLAMAGQRMHLPEFVEVSAVCTHPDARGRGYARALIVRVMEEIGSRGKTPFLHSMADNHAAIRVYESIGFTTRRTLHLAVLRNDA